MSDESLNPNFEWKKKSIGKKERLSRKVNENQILLYESKKKDNFSQALSLKAEPKKISGNLSLLRKRISDALDDDYEEDDEWIFDALNAFNFELEIGENTFFSPDEELKKSSAQQKHLYEMRMQQDAAKIAALNAVNTLAKKNGLDPLSHKDVAENMQNNGWGNETFKMAVENNLAPEIKSSSSQLLNPDDEKILKLVKGLKRLKKIGAVSAVQGMEMNDIIKITDDRFDDNKVAEMLLKKTGRSVNTKKQISVKKKRHQPKVSFKKLLQSKQKPETMKA